MFIKRIFLIVHFHPGKEKRTAAGNDVCQTGIGFNPFRRLPVHAAVNRHKINAVRGVLLNDAEKFFDRNIL